ncbi:MULTISPECIES: flagellar biosynthesis protein FlhF [unclassified Campylobacter]|uniref:flagellar biosynthesis protein FlhF n=1 Tax=unclassified Campylobacter TaxID=2593542 RepID=UPI0012381D0C|nr:MULTISPECIES: flagellar biosynthesis protein FlhF [unclassified Campylobacter]KAA6227171.1 flagellar biosynthesis protein FlhF [Campylobacter sp. LR286c]KAA6227954.1 flagellar biosynthesis protein FlhF [Campylobacter sp. LR185c]KAA6228364.1 flagellar biosynthesis protein FlhF [Campylobacter sp. LR196d]KAA6229365.1 flagellar biosynthesis protein FlhF [Campylobacter sp. LR291e]KAA6231171.1 flagellar biosynthesis protein FlhF [Campylobacter sp. LR264d]
MGQLIRTLEVENTEEIIPRVKEEFGDAAMIITNKQIKPKTMSHKGLYEVVVAIEEEDYEAHLKKMGKKMPKPSTTNPKTQEDVILDFSKRAKTNLNLAQENFKNKLNNKEDDDLNNFKERLSEVSSEISKVTNTTLPNEYEKPNLNASSTNYNKKIESFEKQINKLNDKMNLLVDMMWDDKSGERKNLIIPPEFASIYKQAKESGMLENHLEEIMKATIENMPTSMKTNKDAVQRYFYSLLRNILPCRVESEIKKQKIMMLVGPTGVGKTTTLAKLAFRYAYGDKRYKTGIITLDTYRIGAVEQLFQYAQMMKLPIIDSIEPKDLDEAIKSLSSCEVILVDTIGNSQYDQGKLAKTKEFLTHSDADIDVNLVISANTKHEDLMEIYKNFSFLGIDTLIITKFDETKVFGNIFSLIYETNIPMSFFSIGQEVPDDIEVANSDFLVRCILEGFHKGKIDEQSSK